MTIFGWDTSHFDGNITDAIARKAADEGIEFATAKLGEGGNYRDPLCGSNLGAFRNAGLKVLGAYYVPRTPGISVKDQVDHCIKLANSDIPWWDDFPGWFWQVDLETWGYDNVAASVGITFGEMLADKTDRTAIMYASKGEYGNKLLPWKPEPLWNANYGSNPTGQFKAVYPGDASVGWREYSGQVPSILQYGSKTIIAGQTTCDANAYRGTINDLLTLIGANVAIDDTDAKKIAAAVWNQILGNGPNTAAMYVQTLIIKQVNEHVDLTTKTITDALVAIDAKLDTITTGGGVVDMAAIKAIVNEEIVNALNASKIVVSE